MVIITGLDGRVTWVNDAFTEMTGIAGEEAVGKEPRTVLPLGDGTTVQDDIDAAMSAGEGFDGEIPYVIDGHIRYFQVELCPLRIEGELVGFAGFNRDITSAMNRASEREQTHRLKAIGALAAGVAHEINTPVQYVSDNVEFLRESFEEIMKLLQTLSTALTGTDEQSLALQEQIELADLGFLTEEIPSAIDQTKEGLQRVGRIVDGMRDFSRSGGGHFETDLNRVVLSTLDVTRGEWSYIAELTTDIDDGVGSVVCNEGEIKQVLLTLISNAVHAIEDRSDGEGRLEVSTRRYDDVVTVEVTDNGVGMDDEVRVRAFDAFFTTKDVGRGSGQGLNIARSIVGERHGGTLALRSEPGVGTTATLTLPVSTPTSAGEREAA